MTKDHINSSLSFPVFIGYRIHQLLLLHFIVLSHTSQQHKTTIYNFFLPRSSFSFIFTIARSASQKGRGQQATIKLQVQVQVRKIPKNLSCDWSMRFMKVIFLGLSLVRTSLLYKDWTTVICSCVCALCRQKYSSSVQVVYSTVYSTVPFI